MRIFVVPHTRQDHEKERTRDMVVLPDHRPKGKNRPERALQGLPGRKSGRGARPLPGLHPVVEFPGRGAPADHPRPLRGRARLSSPGVERRQALRRLIRSFPDGRAE